MRFVDFPEANTTLVAAPGDEETVSNLRVCATQDPNGAPVRISCFELEPGDLERLQETGRVWLWVMGSAPHPPVALSVAHPFAAAPAAPTEYVCGACGAILFQAADTCSVCREPGSVRPRQPPER